MSKSEVELFDCKIKNETATNANPSKECTYRKKAQVKHDH
jgi:hypothetical protein